jgi:hypoxanthine phosphoribosyltransferase
MFASDLLKEICIPCEVTFVKKSSYQGLDSSGTIQHLIGPDYNLNGRHLILIEDIVDTGRTISSLLSEMKGLRPASISVASMFVKPDSIQEEVEVRYRGFDIQEKFIVGYGLDYNGYGRNYRDVYSLVG